MRLKEVAKELGRMDGIEGFTCLENDGRAGEQQPCRMWNGKFGRSEQTLVCQLRGFEGCVV
jgi:hypothetical protein